MRLEYVPKMKAALQIMHDVPTTSSSLRLFPLIYLCMDVDNVIESP